MKIETDYFKRIITLSDTNSYSEIYKHTVLYILQGYTENGQKFLSKIGYRRRAIDSFSRRAIMISSNIRFNLI